MTPSPSLLRACGLVGLVGAIFPIFADIVSWLLVSGYSPTANSISALAVGNSSWLIDLGLWAFVVSCVAVAVGLWSWGVRAKWWTPAIASLILLAVCVGIITRVNQYAGTQNPGANVHMWAVWGVGLFFLLTAWLVVPGLRTVSPWLAWLSVVVGALWLVGTPIYWFAVPPGWSGAAERLLAFLMLLWLGTMAWRLRHSGGRAAVRAG
ncbi:MAG TPA: DUF998 domain-containing protein [Paracoccaceae bacterium]|nr:DUF998 domain-containing protein [Paracoccaceae bacterium]